MRYFIVGYPRMYNMQYGIYDYLITDVTFGEARKIGRQLSREVIEEFCHPEEEWYSRNDYVEEKGIEKWGDEYLDDYREKLQAIIEEEIAYKIWEVKPDTTEQAIRLWSNSDDNVEEFVQRYCIIMT